jgi:signal transduction histidine kinase
VLRDEQPAFVLGQIDSLESAAVAVLHNAIKHAPPGGQIDMWTAHSGRYAELHIQDNGPGFSPEALAHALEWFWRGDASSNGDASGIGLAMASSIAQRSGGRVVLLNVPAGGAQVVISLPSYR